MSRNACHDGSAGMDDRSSRRRLLRMGAIPPHAVSRSRAAGATAAPGRRADDDTPGGHDDGTPGSAQGRAPSPPAPAGRTRPHRSRQADERRPRHDGDDVEVSRPVARSGRGALPRDRLLRVRRSAGRSHPLAARSVPPRVATDGRNHGGRRLPARRGDPARDALAARHPAERRHEAHGRQEGQRKGDCQGEHQSPPAGRIVPSAARARSARKIRPMNSRFFMSRSLVYWTGAVVTVFPTSGCGGLVKAPPCRRSSRSSPRARRSSHRGGSGHRPAARPEPYPAR